MFTRPFLPRRGPPPRKSRLPGNFRPFFSRKLFLSRRREDQFVSASGGLRELLFPFAIVPCFYAPAREAIFAAEANGACIVCHVSRYRPAEFAAARGRFAAALHRDADGARGPGPRTHTQQRRHHPALARCRDVRLRRRLAIRLRAGLQSANSGIYRSPALSLIYRRANRGKIDTTR